MKAFLDDVARSGQLKQPLPVHEIEGNDTANFLRTPLWDYLGQSRAEYFLIQRITLQCSKIFVN